MNHPCSTPTSHARSSRRGLVLLILLVCGVAAGVVAKTGGARLLRVSAVGAARPEVGITLDGTIARDEKNVALADADAVRPGEILTWTIKAENAGDGAARGFSTVGRIPAGTSFVAGSAVSSADVRVTYSIDAGKTFAATPEVEERLADGPVKRVAAPVAMYTQVRYEWADPLAAGQSVNATYKVRVR